MPTAKQITVNPPQTDGTPGKSNSILMSECFAASPIHQHEDPLSDDGTLDAAIRTHFQSLCLDGVVNDGGHTFGEYNLDFAAGAPDYGDVETGEGGLPASPWVPNPASPGPGSMNPTDLPAPPDGYGETPNPQWGTGVGTALSPKNSSEQISGQKLGDYVLGKSVQE